VECRRAPPDAIRSGGTGTGTVQLVTASLPGVGTYGGSVSISASGTSVVPVRCASTAGGSQLPFGAFDAPVDGTTRVSARSRHRLGHGRLVKGRSDPVLNDGAGLHGDATFVAARGPTSSGCAEWPNSVGAAGASCPDQRAAGTRSAPPAAAARSLHVRVDAGPVADRVENNHRGQPHRRQAWYVTPTRAAPLEQRLRELRMGDLGRRFRDGSTTVVDGAAVGHPTQQLPAVASRRRLPTAPTRRGRLLHPR
jgi:hypothetical protein